MMQRCDQTLARGQLDHDVSGGHALADGRLRAFKPGAFEIAQSRRPILPIAIEGTADALPKRGFVLQGPPPDPDPVLDPIPPESFETDPEQLGTHTREVIEKHLERGVAARNGLKYGPDRPITRHSRFCDRPRSRSNSSGVFALKRRPVRIHCAEIRPLQIAHANLFEEPPSASSPRGQPSPRHPTHRLTAIQRTEGVGPGPGARNHRIRLGPGQERQEQRW